MFRYRTADEVRRFDLMKLAVLLALLLLLLLTWAIFREETAPSLVGEDMIATPLPTAIDDSVVIATGEQPAPTAEAETSEVVATPLSPSGGLTIDIPAGALAPGNNMLSGQAEPGSQVVVIVDGQPVGTATAGVDGAWSLPAELASGVRTLSTQVIDNLGNVLSESPPVTVVVQPPAEDSTQPTEPTAPAEPGETAVNPPALDPDTGAYRLSGTAAPGSMVTLSSGGTILGAVTADESGNWTAGMDPSISGDIQVETVDVGGNIVVSVVTLPAPAETAETGEPGAESTGTGGADETTAQPGVVSPYNPESISGFLAADPAQFSILLSALEATGLAGALDGTNPFTLFAPTNTAFLALPEEVLEALVSNPQALSQVLQYHAARGVSSAADLQVVAPATVNNLLWTITPAGDVLRVNDATVTNADNMTANGVVHVIDRVLVPPLATGIRPPVIDESGIPTFTGPSLTVVGTGQPGSTLLLELNGEPFGARATISPSGFWQVAGEVSPGEYRIVAYMLDSNGILQAISRTVTLTAP